MPYTPHPLATEHVTLSNELENLIERLAENAHDVWAAQRIGEGWSYGTNRNDVQKLHPCIVPYYQLPESEKEYDRRAVTQVLKSLLALGYNIVRESDLKE